MLPCTAGTKVDGLVVCGESGVVDGAEVEGDAVVDVVGAGGGGMAATFDGEGAVVGA